MNPEKPSSVTPRAESNPVSGRHSTNTARNNPASDNIEFDFGGGAAPYEPVVVKAPQETSVAPEKKQASAPAPAEEAPAKPVAPEKPAATTKTQPASGFSGSAKSIHSTGPERAKEPTTIRSSTMALNPPTVSDFRKNAERQAKEQRAVGSVLQWVGFSLLGGLLLVASIAGFGGYTLYKMINAQSVTVAQLDASYKDQFAKQQASLDELRAESDKLTEQLAATANLMAKQQEQLKRTAAAADDSASQLKARTRELSELRDRVRRLEGYRGR